MHNHNDKLINSFINDNIGIDTNFISKELSNGLQQNIKKLEANNQMIPAGIGNNAVMDTTQQMRGDKIYWLDKTHDNAYEQQFLLKIEAFIDRLNYTCYTGING